MDRAREALADSTDQPIEQWICSAREGCQKSLNDLIAACQSYLLAIANREIPADVQPKCAPSDLVQESVAEACRDFASFTGNKEAEFLAWLRVILINNLANATRKFRRTAKRSVARELPLNDCDSGSGPGIQLEHSTPTPSSIFAATEQLSQVEVAIGKLPPDYQQVIHLRHREHLSFEEIAIHLGKKSAATRKLWSRAIERLREELHVDDERLE